MAFTPKDQASIDEQRLRHLSNHFEKVAVKSNANWQKLKESGQLQGGNSLADQISVSRGRAPHPLEEKIFSSLELIDRELAMIEKRYRKRKGY